MELHYWWQHVISRLRALVRQSHSLPQSALEDFLRSTRVEALTASRLQTAAPAPSSSLLSVQSSSTSEGSTSRTPPQPAASISRKTPSSHSHTSEPGRSRHSRQPATRGPVETLTIRNVDWDIMDGAAKMCKAKRLANRVAINSNADGIVREKSGSTIQCHTPPPEQEYDPFSSEGEANVLKWRSSTKIVPVDNIKSASQPRLDGRERIGDEVVQSQTENGAIFMA